VRKWWSDGGVWWPYPYLESFSSSFSLSICFRLNPLLRAIGSLELETAKSELRPTNAFPAPPLPP
jgi:hypothetical protein